MCYFLSVKKLLTAFIVKLVEGIYYIICAHKREREKRLFVNFGPLLLSRGLLLGRSLILPIAGAQYSIVVAVEIVVSRALQLIGKEKSPRLSRRPGARIRDIYSIETVFRPPPQRRAPDYSHIPQLRERKI